MKTKIDDEISNYLLWQRLLSCELKDAAKKRAIYELECLHEKIISLSAFLKSGSLSHLSFIEKFRLKLQRKYMKKYEKILYKRILNWRSI